ncbi:hypothetical protein [Paraburkholderia mimosarum]|uniref:hypothetical protein n=1 Tax=Paraburkholderia mimosarum TaxID=312026 RepID=UPI001EE27CD8|nr:hypothetical protein [Paraburkholderia mimosarum]
MWPTFMRHDHTAKLYFGAGVFSTYLDFAYAGLVDEAVIGRAFGVPFASNIAGRMELPDGGWDEVIRWAHEDSLLGREPTTISPLEITLLPKARGFGNALALLNALKQCAKMAVFLKTFGSRSAKPETPCIRYANVPLYPTTTPGRFADGFLVANPHRCWRKAHEN